MNVNACANAAVTLDGVLYFWYTFLMSRQASVLVSSETRASGQMQLDGRRHSLV